MKCVLSCWNFFVSEWFRVVAVFLLSIDSSHCFSLMILNYKELPEFLPMYLTFKWDRACYSGTRLKAKHRSIFSLSWCVLGSSWPGYWIDWESIHIPDRLHIHSQSSFVGYQTDYIKNYVTLCTFGSSWSGVVWQQTHTDSKCSFVGCQTLYTRNHKMLCIFEGLWLGMSKRPYHLLCWRFIGRISDKGP